VKRCFRCRDPLPLTAFHRCARNADGYGSTCKQCLRQPRVCEWCGRERLDYRRLPEGGYECPSEKQCAAPRRRNHGKLVRLGVDEVVRVWKQHQYSQRSAATALDVTQTAISHYLNRHAPEEVRVAREHGLMPRNNNAHKAIHADRATLHRVLRCHGYCMAPAARELGHHKTWLRKELRRAYPDLYARLPELRRSA